MKMRKCGSCNEYTLKDICPYCNGDVFVVYPPKFSPEDKFARYRRKFKEEKHEN